jgi:hypothetical protein
MRRVVTRLPLNELWDDNGPLIAKRRRDLTHDDISDLLRAGPVRFVVANIPDPLRWVPSAECFQFWKSEAKARVGNPAGVYLENHDDGYCYFASEWAEDNGPPIVLLSLAH